MIIKITYRSGDTETIEIGKMWTEFKLSKEMLLISNNKKKKHIPLTGIESFIVEEANGK